MFHRFYQPFRFFDNTQRQFHLGNAMFDTVLPSIHILQILFQIFRSLLRTFDHVRCRVQSTLVRVEQQCHVVQEFLSDGNFPSRCRCCRRRRRGSGGGCGSAAAHINDFHLFCTATTSPPLLLGSLVEDLLIIDNFSFRCLLLLALLPATTPTPCTLREQAVRSRQQRFINAIQNVPLLLLRFVVLLEVQPPYLRLDLSIDLQLRLFLKITESETEAVGTHDHLYRAGDALFDRAFFLLLPCRFRGSRWVRCGIVVCFGISVGRCASSTTPHRVPSSFGTESPRSLVSHLLKQLHADALGVFFPFAQVGISFFRGWLWVRGEVVAVVSEAETAHHVVAGSAETEAPAATGKGREVVVVVVVAIVTGSKPNPRRCPHSQAEASVLRLGRSVGFCGWILPSDSASVRSRAQSETASIIISLQRICIIFGRIVARRKSQTGGCRRRESQTGRS
mmetsp:Transcript_21471/g.45380  ORF Transcript_21471/g.45380 Transcript_21471/m.45380 type:complete len:450 (-) Transcript_21471:760-2109(-)